MTSYYTMPSSYTSQRFPRRTAKKEEYQNAHKVTSQTSKIPPKKSPQGRPTNVFRIVGPSVQSIPAINRTDTCGASDTENPSKRWKILMVLMVQKLEKPDFLSALEARFSCFTSVSLIFSRPQGVLVCWLVHVPVSYPVRLSWHVQKSPCYIRGVYLSHPTGRTNSRDRTFGGNTFLIGLISSEELGTTGY